AAGGGGAAATDAGRRVRPGHRGDQRRGDPPGPGAPPGAAGRALPAGRPPAPPSRAGPGAGPDGVPGAGPGGPPVKKLETENVLLVGNPGTGKTHLATALAVAACGRGKRVRFWRVTELVTQLMEAREERVLQRWKAQLGRLDLLVLDERGYVPTSRLGAELL